MMDWIISEELFGEIIAKLVLSRKAIDKTALNSADGLIENVIDMLEALPDRPQTGRPVVSREGLEAQIALELSGCDLILTVSAPFIGERMVTQKIGADSGKILARHLVNKIPSLQLPTTQPVAGQPTELVMGGPESRYRPPIIGTAGQVGEAIEEAYRLVKEAPDEMIQPALRVMLLQVIGESLRQPVETVGNYAEIVARWDAEEHLALSSRQKDKLVNALRTQPQAPVVEDLLVMIDAEISNGRQDDVYTDEIVDRIRPKLVALLQRTAGR